MRARTYWRTADARRALKALDRSGLAAAEFARRSGIQARRLQRWRRRLEAETPGSMGVQFLPVQVADQETAPTAVEAPPFEVAVAGRIVRVPPGFDDEALVRLVRALERAGC